MTIRPGPRNLLTDVPGFRVGNAEDGSAITGVSVVLPDAPAVAAVDVRGGGPGTRETDALAPGRLVERVDAVVLSGGSAFGLAAADAAMVWLAERGRGFQVGDFRVPIVPAAVLFDLANGGDKAWGAEPPYARLARLACDAAALDFALGNAGAGMGAKAGDIKGGLGSASAVDDDGLAVAALVAANPVGSATYPGQSTLWAWALEQGGEMGGQAPPTAAADLEPDFPFLRGLAAGGNTTLAVVATNADLGRGEALRVAMMAQDGFARAIRPAHTPFDGDTAFVLASATHALAEPRAMAVARIGALAADCVARAIGRAIVLAESAGAFTSWRERFGKG
ncbi:P1 family peptidase [Oleispirillum naphthae]|uniref:P1 family peptidase n=1 Tax=Oleispirillum naphthae TaxID=2838853 RepID=UPI003082466C